MSFNVSFPHRPGDLPARLAGTMYPTKQGRPLKALGLMLVRRGWEGAVVVRRRDVKPYRFSGPCQWFVEDRCGIPSLCPSPWWAWCPVSGMQEGRACGGPVESHEDKPGRRA